MIRKILMTIVTLVLTYWLVGQNENQIKAQKTLSDRGEVYFQFQLEKEQQNGELIKELIRMISVDKVTGDKVTAYANKREFDQFMALSLDYEVLTPPSMLHKPRMLGTNEINSRTDWDFYPSYFAYLDIMDQFVEDYPHLCELVTIETLVSERQILAIHINDSLGIDQGEPEFLYTSSMHGDELTGFIMTLHLIEYLLENHGTDDQVNKLVNNIDIWINPLANPDGTYAGGNSSVYGATRGNANGIDFNRNFPDPEDGQHPDGNDWQPETMAFMAFAEEHNFVMSANFHGGAEVCNYPWDTWWTRHADDDWWIYVCRQFADTVHEYAPNGYMTDLDNGISNGYDWYSINGGRQDYMNYYHHCREFTAEISGTKLPPANQMPDFWDYLHRSLLNYIEQALYGIHGNVTNVVNGNAVPAKVFVEEHDKDQSHVFAALPFGDFHRPIKQGTYDLTFSSLGYYSKSINNVSAEDMETFILDVELQPYISLTADFLASDTLIELGGVVDFTDTSLGNNIVEWQWTFEGGTPSSSNDQYPSDIAYNVNGYFNVSLTIIDNVGGTSTLDMEDFILVTNGYTMKDTTIYLCDGLFYDSGGSGSNYMDDEDYTTTFISLYESGMLEVVFLDFEIEDSDACEMDYIEAFNGSDINAPLIGKWCGNEIPNSITANNINGALTFRFHSNEITNLPGWRAFVTCDTSVGIYEVEDDNLTIFPNPARDNLTIQSTDIIKKLTIFAVDGMEVYNASVLSESTSFNVDNFKPGVYIVAIETNGNSFSKKLIIK